MDEQTLVRLATFLRNLGQAMHLSGTPAHTLENALRTIGLRLGVQVEGFAVLTLLTLTVVSGDAQLRRVELVRLPPYDYNMARLIELEMLCGDVASIENLDAYSTRLATIMGKAPLWSGWRFISMGFALSGAVALLLGGGWTEMFCGGIIGMLFVAGYMQFARTPQLAPAAPVILCALAAMAAQALAYLFPNQVPFVAAVAGVVLLLPGFTLTVAMSELATHNVLAGTARLTGAFVLLFLMGAGLTIGTQISLYLLPAQLLGTATQLPSWIIWLAISALGVSLLAVLQAPWSSLHVSVGACLLAWAIYSLFSVALGNMVGAFAAALAVASAGHLYAYLTGRPAALIQIPGLITLVPGSMGFRGLHALIQQDSGAGIRLITDMMLTGAVLAVGLLLADNILPMILTRELKVKE